MHFPSDSRSAFAGRFSAWTLSSTAALSSSDFPHGASCGEGCYTSDAAPARPSRRPSIQRRYYSGDCHRAPTRACTLGLPDIPGTTSRKRKRRIGRPLRPNASRARAAGGVPVRLLLLPCPAHLDPSSRFESVAYASGSSFLAVPGNPGTTGCFVLPGRLVPPACPSYNPGFPPPTDQASSIRRGLSQRSL